MKFTPFALLALSSAGVSPAATLGEFAIAEGLKSHCALAIAALVEEEDAGAVSYTHLTLPTICSV